jgi:hypothetical protein
VRHTIKNTLTTAKTRAQAAAATPATASPPRRSGPPWRAITAGTGLLSGEATAGYLHPALGQALAIADITAPLIITITLTAVILRGSNQTIERTFRLLRCITNRPEPPPPEPEAARPPGPPPTRPRRNTRPQTSPPDHPISPGKT